MLKNAASQKIAVFAFDTTTGAAKTGDSANITAYLSKDWGSVTQLTDTSATEMDSTNAKGWYLFDISQTETNADALLVTGKSTTANISVVGQLIFTLPANFTTLSVDGSGRVDVAKVGGTSQTARDLGASVLLSNGTGSGQISLSSGTVTVGTNNDKTGYTASTVSDKTGYALTSAYDPAKTASQAGDAMALTSGERNSTADAILSRGASNVEGSANAHSLCAVILGTLESSVSGGTWTIKKTDGSTTFTTKTITTDAAAAPIVTVG